LPGVVPVAFRAAGADQRHRLLVGSRPDEATPEHLHGGAAAARRAGGGSDDGGRQLHARRRGRSRGRDAGGAAQPRRRRGTQGCRRSRCPRDPLPARIVGPIVITYRDLTTLEEFAVVVQLERDIWGPAYDDVVPVPILAVSVHSGGILIGAFDER